MDKSLITSITSVGALVASPLSGLLADSLGRKPVILLSDVLFVVGALVQAAAGTVPVMVLGRAVVGLAIGTASGLTPLYIAETSPAAWRGRLVTVSVLFITFGQVVAYVVGWLFSDTAHGWRWMVGLGAVPAVLQFVSMLLMPETPRWLVRAGKREKATRVLGSMYRDDEDIVRGLVKKMEREIEEETAGKSGVGNTLRELVGVASNRKALTVACMLQGSQQLCGFVSIT
jgi:SP family myo-inositol transporter-like MFS transporter 13